MAATDFTLPLQKLCKLLGKQYVLKEKQVECLTSLLTNDTIAILPTGYGKSLIFEMLPFIKSTDIRSECVCIVVTPFNSILFERGNKYGQSALILTPSMLDRIGSSCGGDVQRLVKCDFLYLLGHPEHLLDERIWPIYLSSVWQQVVRYIVVDKCHCIVRWGGQFRKDYQNLSRLRSAFPAAKVLGLTATASTCMQLQIAKNLSMENVVFVLVILTETM